MIKRLGYLLQRVGTALFPLPSPGAYAAELIEHAEREALRNEALAELHEAAADKARIDATMLRQRITRMQREGVKR
jgi:hypothetical protein